MIIDTSPSATAGARNLSIMWNKTYRTLHSMRSEHAHGTVKIQRSRDRAKRSICSR